MPIVTATHINYYHICKHKLWLFANGISMEHTSLLVAEGKVLHNTAYGQRAKKYREIQLNGSKIDYYDPKGKVIHEIKKSDSMSEVDTWQIKYYMWLFEENGILGVVGRIEYPYLRETKKVALNETDKIYFKNIRFEIIAIISNLRPPVRIRTKICDHCAYYDFCWITK
jgi:CRISPR-associated exonuclease Cas4